MKSVILVVDDEPGQRQFISGSLSGEYVIVAAADGKEASELLSHRSFNLVITDERMPHMGGIELLRWIRKNFPETPVIVLTAYGSVDSAVEAIKRGAYDYLTKPFRTELLLEKLDRLLTCRKLNEGSAELEIETVGPLVAQSPTSRRLFEKIRNIADNERAILIQGENGTGKKTVAETIHNLGRRAHRRMHCYH